VKRGGLASREIGEGGGQLAFKSRKSSVGCGGKDWGWKKWGIREGVGKKGLSYRARVWGKSSVFPGRNGGGGLSKNP